MQTSFPALSLCAVLVSAAFGCAGDEGSPSASDSGSVDRVASGGNGAAEKDGAGGPSGGDGGASTGGSTSGGHGGDGSDGAAGTSIGNGGTADSGQPMPDGMTPDAPISATFRVYLAPAQSGGNDANSGTDVANPIATLRRALAVISASKPAMNIEVLMAPGVYYTQSVVWTYTNPSYGITFMPRDAGSSVVFDGCLNASTDYAKNCPDATGDGDGHLFLLGSHTAGDTNLVFEHLEIRHYRNGVRFANGRSARNRISNSYFHHIGNGWAPNLSYANLPGYGAVRSSESSYNQFIGNRFSHIENVPGSCEVCAGHMHSYYLSKSSDNNTFENERHEYISGGPVRFRDYSNHNTIRGGTFIAGGLTKGAVSDFYSPDGGECPCFDINIHDLEVYGDWDCARSTSIWVPYNEASSCTRPALMPRAAGSGNCTTTAAPYCSTSTACRPASVTP